MKKRTKFVIIFIGSTGIVLFIFIFIFFKSPQFLRFVFCSEDPLAISQSSDGKHEALAVLRNCGATTPSVYVECIDNKEVFLASDLGALSAEWISNTEVTINAPTTTFSRIVHGLNSQNGVKINYRYSTSTIYWFLK